MVLNIACFFCLKVLGLLRLLLQILGFSSSNIFATWHIALGHHMLFCFLVIVHNVLPLSHMGINLPRGSLSAGHIVSEFLLLLSFLCFGCCSSSCRDMTSVATRARHLCIVLSRVGAYRCLPANVVVQLCASVCFVEVS